MNPLGKSSQALISAGRERYLPNYNPREMILDHGQGVMLHDLDGNQYIDFGAGIAVNSLGHADPELRQVLKEQADKLWHTSNIYFTEPAIHLAEELTASSFAERVYFCNSGGEANEAAIKLARKYASEKHSPEQREIITFTGGFHGRTMATVTATAQPKYHAGFEPLPGGFVYCPFNDFEAVEKLVSDKTCAILVEPLQGEGGITLAADGFLKHLRKLCDKHDALLMFDEIQCGMGRTGKLYGHEWDAVVPDVMTLAKALGCGFPIGAMLVNAKVQHVLQVGSHGSTFGGNPMAAAVARVALRRLSDPALLEQVQLQGEILRAGLEDINKEFNVFSEVRGRGLMLGAELTQNLHGKAGDIMEAARRAGVLILQAGPNVIRFLPPLIINSHEISQGIDRLAAAIRLELGKA